MKWDSVQVCAVHQIVCGPRDDNKDGATDAPTDS